MCEFSETEIGKFPGGTRCCAAAAGYTMIKSFVPFGQPFGKAKVSLVHVVDGYWHGSVSKINHAT